MKIDQKTFFPHRKEVGIIGSCFLAVSLLLCYRFLETRQVLYAGLDLITVVISIYLLGPFFRNPIVDIVEDAIVLHSFWKKYKLLPDDLDEIVSHKNGGISYQFSTDESFFRVTPKGYYNGEEMQIVFDKIFGNKNPVAGKQKTQEDSILKRRASKTQKNNRYKKKGFTTK